jgi:hypothetical protein
MRMGRGMTLKEIAVFGRRDLIPAPAGVAPDQKKARTNAVGDHRSNLAAGYSVTDGGTGRELTPFPAPLAGFPFAAFTGSLALLGAPFSSLVQGGPMKVTKKGLMYPRATWPRERADRRCRCPLDPASARALHGGARAERLHSAALRHPEPVSALLILGLHFSAVIRVMTATIQRSARRRRVAFQEFSVYGVTNTER